jgi:hypothetical protein
MVVIKSGRWRCYKEKGPVALSSRIEEGVGEKIKIKEAGPDTKHNAHR